MFRERRIAKITVFSNTSHFFTDAKDHSHHTQKAEGMFLAQFELILHTTNYPRLFGILACSF